MDEDELTDKKPLDSNGNADVNNVDSSSKIDQDAIKSLISGKKSAQVDVNQPDDKQTKIEDDKPSTIESASQTADKGDNVFKRFHKLSQKDEKAKVKRNSDNVTTIIVIAYTILLLALGFIVYRDLTRRLHILDNRVSRVEALLTDKKNITIDNIEIYDLE